MRIIIHGTNWIGDAVMTLPALEIVRESIPEAEITLYSRDWAEGVFATVESIDNILTVPSDEKGIRAQAALWRKNDYDAALLLTNSFRTALVARAAGVKKRVGYAGEGRGILLTDSIAKPEWKGVRHETEYYNALAAEFCRRIAGRDAVKGGSEPKIPVSSGILSEAYDFLASKGAPKGTRIIGLGPGSQNSDAKRWPAERFGELAKLLASAFNARICLFGSPAEKSVALEIAEHAGDAVIDLVGETRLVQIPALLSACDCFISNDMGLAHVARAVGTEAVTIFGPTDPATTVPIGSKVIRRDEVECSPCMLRECPIDHRCMTRIKVDDVFEIIKSIV